MVIKKHIAIIGGGASALMLACCIDTTKYTVSLYEKNSTLGRKFLVAGKGGFNLTHSEPLEQFADRYYPKSFIEPFLKDFSNVDFRIWLQEIGIETYVGTSKRVFPVKGIKPIEVLKAIEKKIILNGVTIHYNYDWKEWKNENLIFQHNETENLISPDITIFALGGASWKVTGSNGNWKHLFAVKGIETVSFQPSNCAFQIQWNTNFIQKHAGSALKNCEFSCGTIKRKGEATLTEFGIEGSGVYPLSRNIREDLSKLDISQLFVDLKPDLSIDEVIFRLENKGNLTVKAVLEKKLNLTDLQIDLLKSISSKDDYNSVVILAGLIKSLPLTVIALAPIDEAISTIGGISLETVTEHLELKQLPQHYCIGEMLNWDAPTGGYLLQVCFSMGYALAKHLNTF